MLLAEKIKISTKYSDFFNVLLEKKALVLWEITKLNQHSIKLQDDKQVLYKPIYSLGLIKPTRLKTYIKTNLINGFICLSKLPVSTLIFFV